MHQSPSSSIARVIYEKPLTIVSGIVTIDCNELQNEYYLYLTEDVTGWNFLNPPTTSYNKLINILIKQNTVVAYGCVCPGTEIAGGDWTQGVALGVKELISLTIRNNTDRLFFAGGPFQ